MYQLTEGDVVVDSFPTEWEKISEGGPTGGEWQLTKLTVLKIKHPGDGRFVVEFPFGQKILTCNPVEPGDRIEWRPVVDPDPHDQQYVAAVPPNYQRPEGFQGYLKFFK